MTQKESPSPRQKNPREDISQERKEMPVYTVPYSPSPFFSMNISAMVSSPQTQHPSPQIHELPSLMVHSPFSQVAEIKEFPPLLDPPLVLSSLDSPLTCGRDPPNHLSVFHFHLLEVIPPLAGIEVVILEMSQSNISTFSLAAWHQVVNLHEVGVTIFWILVFAYMEL